MGFEPINDPGSRPGALPIELFPHVCLVAPEVIETSHPGCKPGALPLSYGAMAEEKGFEPSQDPGSEPGVLPIELLLIKCSINPFIIEL